MSKEAQILIKDIQYKTGKTLEEIANDIGYSRPYINNVKLNGGGEKIIGLLKEKYSKILQNVSRDTLAKEADPKYNVPIKEKVHAHDALLAVLVAEFAQLKATVSGEHPEVITKKIYKAAQDVAILNGNYIPVRPWGRKFSTLPLNNF